MHLSAEPSEAVIGTVLQCVALGNDTTLTVPNGLELVSRLGHLCCSVDNDEMVSV